MGPASRREIDVDRVRALAAASGGRVGIVTLPLAGRPRFVLELDYATAGSHRYPQERQPSSRVSIDLAARHPFEPPVTTVLTPVFHPHVFASGIVCIGSRWMPGEGMDLFVQRIVRLLAFDPLLMNPDSIAHAAAQAWYQAALQRHPQAFPSDAAALDLSAGDAGRDATPGAGAASGGAPRVIRHCPGCGAALRLPAGRAGSVACPACGREFETRT